MTDDREAWGRVTGDLHFDNEDFLAFLAQDLVMRDIKNSLKIGDLDLQLERLFNGVTKETWSSFVVWSETSPMCWTRRLRRFCANRPIA